MNRERKLQHFYLDIKPNECKYSSRRGGAPSTNFKLPDPDKHGPQLRAQLQNVAEHFQEVQSQRQKIGLGEIKAQILAVDFNPAGIQKIDPFENKKDDVTIASVVPPPRENRSNFDNDTDKEPPKSKEDKATLLLHLGKGSLTNLKLKVDKYSNPKELTKNGNRRYTSILGGVSSIREVKLLDLWQGDKSALLDPDKALVWEVWTPQGDSPSKFRKHSKKFGLTVYSDQALEFPDRQVLLCYGTVQAMDKALENLGNIVELRPPSIIKEFLNLSDRDQKMVTDGFEAIAPPPDSSRVCLLDQGLDAHHKLLTNAIDHDVVLSVKDAWGTDDIQDGGHGTNMAGVVLFGEDLPDILTDNKPFQYQSRIESVKIIKSESPHEPQLYGEVTQSAVARAEIEFPTWNRIFCMAVSATPSSDGSPSSWSAALDQICSGGVEQDKPKRLMVIAAGNAPYSKSGFSYPGCNHSSCVDDPGQAWNPLVIGAFTKHSIVDPDFPESLPIAPAGGLSPSSTCSLPWESKWPNRPDVVLEGGNFIQTSENLIQPSDAMSILTTRPRYIGQSRLLTAFGETSAACALATKLCAEIQNEFEDIWPETVRALVVHSARWTQAMEDSVSDKGGKQRYGTLLRTVGMGVPHLDRALKSSRDSLTFVIQQTIKPFENRNGSLNEMHLYELPWPRQVLEDLLDTPVRMRVTLSYFIEPRPGKREFSYKYRYASHGLNFEVKTASETVEQFLERINKAVQLEEDTPRTESDSKEWLIGPQNRNRGSIHSDIWEGTAAALADKDAIAIVPVKGWWAEVKEKCEGTVRYSLVVSIETKEVQTDIDLYTEVENQIELSTSVSVDAETW